MQVSKIGGVGGGAGDDGLDLKVIRPLASIAEGAKAGVVRVDDTQTPDDPSFIYV